MKNIRTAKEYSIFCNDKLMIFEFFMPLTNENSLRNSLDALFYRDSVLKRLKSIDAYVLERYFTKEETEDYEAYIENICRWVSDNFGGYSISHVNGRYRAKELSSLYDAYRYAEKGDSYLVDETTAVAKFIFPCGEEKIVNENSFEPVVDNFDESISQEIKNEYNKIRFLFFKLFVQNIIQIVNEEDEIWMRESGMRNRLYYWR